MTLDNKEISTYLVGSALGSNSRDVGTLCTHKSINIWSKWKPIESNIGTMTLDELKTKKFGLSILEANTAKLLVDKINGNSSKGFKYNAPVSKYRLGDFRNYNSDAPVPCELTYADIEEINIGGVTSQNHSSYERECGGIETQSTVSTIGVDDLYYYTNSAGERKRLIRGFYVTDGTNSEWYTDKFYWWTNSMQKFANKDVTIYEFYTNVTKGSDGVIRHPDKPNVTGATGDDRFYAIPFPKYTKHIKSETPAGSRIVATMLAAEFVANPSNPMDLSKVSYSVYFDARGEVYRGGTISNVWIKLCRDSKGVDVIDQKRLADTLKVDDEKTSLTFTGTFANKGKDAMSLPSSLVYVIVWYNYQLQSSVMPMMSRPNIRG